MLCMALQDLAHAGGAAPRRAMLLNPAVMQFAGISRGTAMCKVSMMVSSTHLVATDVSIYLVGLGTGTPRSSRHKSLSTPPIIILSPTAPGSC